MTQRIDLHTHVLPPAWEDWAAKYGGGRWPRLQPRDGCRATIMTGDQFFRDIDDRSWSPERRIEDMDRLGIDRQALSPPPVMFCYWADARANQAFARMQNEHVAGIAARHAARFVGMATVPLQDVDLAIAELRYCRERLGLQGGGDRLVPRRPRLRRSRPATVLRGLRRPGRGGLRPPGQPADRPGPPDQVLLPAHRRQPAGDRAGDLQADLRRRAGALAAPAHRLRPRRRRVPVHAGPARSRLEGAPGRAGGDPAAAARVCAACSTSTRSR